MGELKQGLFTLQKIYKDITAERQVRQMKHTKQTAWQYLAGYKAILEKCSQIEVNVLMILSLIYKKIYLFILLILIVRLT